MSSTTLTLSIDITSPDQLETASTVISSLRQLIGYQEAGAGVEVEPVAVVTPPSPVAPAPRKRRRRYTNSKETHREAIIRVVTAADQPMTVREILTARGIAMSPKTGAQASSVALRLVKDGVFTRENVRESGGPIYAYSLA